MNIPDKKMIKKLIKQIRYYEAMTSPFNLKHFASYRAYKWQVRIEQLKKDLRFFFKYRNLNR